jgi:hypothetical protein
MATLRETRATRMSAVAGNATDAAGSTPREAWTHASRSYPIEVLAVHEGQQPMNSGPIAFGAKVVAGLGKANQTIAAQLRQIIQYLSEVRGCHSGSINLELEEPLQVNNPDFTIPSIYTKSH